MKVVLDRERLCKATKAEVLAATHAVDAAWSW